MHPHLATTEPVIVTVINRDSHCVIEEGKISISFSLRLAESVGARLIKVEGLTDQVFVFASFTQPQPFGSGQEQLLGLSSTDHNPIIPLLHPGGGTLSQCSIQLLRINGQPFEQVPHQPIFVLIQLIQ